MINKNLLLFWAIVIGAVFIAHHFSTFIEEMVVAGNTFAWVYLFAWYLVWVGVIGTIAGKMLRVRF